MSVTKVSRNFESETIGALPADITITKLRTAGYIIEPDIKVAAGGPDGYSKVLKLEAVDDDLAYQHSVLFDIADPVSTTYCQVLYLFRMIDPAPGGWNNFFTINQLDLVSSPTHFYRGSVDYNSSGTNDYTFVRRYYNLSSDPPDSQAVDSDVFSAGISLNTWYFLRYTQNNGALSVKVWEAGTEEPASANSSGTSGTVYSGNPQFGLWLIGSSKNNAWELAAYSASFDSGTAPDDITYGNHGVSNLDFEDASITGLCGALASLDFEEFIESGYGGGTAAVEVDITPDGYGNFLGSMAFAESTIAAESFGGGDAAIDFPEFSIHQTLSAYGEVEWDISDTFSYTGRSGAVGSTLFSSAVILATGNQLVTGDAAATFEEFTLDGEGNFSGTVTHSDFVIDASGFVLPVGHGAVSHSFAVAATGIVGTHSVGSSNIVFSSFQVSGTSAVRISGSGQVVFPGMILLASSTQARHGDAAIGFSTASIAATGKAVPHGHGAIEFDIDILAHASNDQCYHKLLEYVR